MFNSSRQRRGGSQKIALVVGGLCAALLGWVAVSTRAGREARHNAKISKPVYRTAQHGPAPTEDQDSVSARIPGRTPSDAIIGEQIQALEDKKRALEAKMSALEADHAGLEKQYAENTWERGAEARAGILADSLKYWGLMLGLTESQKALLGDLWRGWTREDWETTGGDVKRTAPRERWQAREDVMRAILTSEQSVKFQEQAASGVIQDWPRVAALLMRVAGIPASDLSRIQLALGTLSPPANMLFREAHGFDFGGLLREAASRAKSLLTPEQAAHFHDYTKQWGSNK